MSRVLKLENYFLPDFFNYIYKRMEPYIQAISLFTELKDRIDKKKQIDYNQLEKYKSDCIKKGQYQAAAEIRKMVLELRSRDLSSSEIQFKKNQA